MHSVKILRPLHEFRLTDNGEEATKIFLDCHYYKHAVCVDMVERYRRLSFLRCYIRTLNLPTSDEDLEEGLYIPEQAVQNPWYEG